MSDSETIWANVDRWWRTMYSQVELEARRLGFADAQQMMQLRYGCWWWPQDGILNVERLAAIERKQAATFPARQAAKNRPWWRRIGREGSDER